MDGIKLPESITDLQSIMRMPLPQPPGFLALHKTTDGRILLEMTADCVSPGWSRSHRFYMLTMGVDSILDGSVIVVTGGILEPGFEVGCLCFMQVPVKKTSVKYEVNGEKTEISYSSIGIMRVEIDGLGSGADEFVKAYRKMRG